MLGRAAPPGLSACLGAAAELTAALLAGSWDEVLDLAVAHARRLTSAAMACIELLDGPDAMRVRAFDAAGAAQLAGRTRPLAASSPYREVAMTGRAVLAPAEASGRIGTAADLAGLTVGHVLVAALPAADPPLGTLTLAAEPGRAPFTPEDLGVAGLLAGQAALALRLGRALDHRDQSRRAGEQDRVARMLHDVVMQRLFATGLGLQGLVPTLIGPAAETTAAAVDALNQTMSDVRTAIVALRPAGDEASLRAALIDAVADAVAGATGGQPADSGHC